VLLDNPPRLVRSGHGPAAPPMARKITEGYGLQPVRKVGRSFAALAAEGHVFPPSVAGHLLRNVGGLIAKVLLVDHALLADEERHVTAGAISRGVGNKTEATVGESATKYPTLSL
jgi:hypothetical protein